MKNIDEKPTTTVTIRLEKDILEFVKRIALAERRSINAQINVFLEKVKIETENNERMAEENGW